jgi:2'-5' RNA ligase
VPEQLSFGGFDPPRRAAPRDSGEVYLALLPDEAATVRCVLCARAVQRQTGLRGRVREGSFHASLHYVGPSAKLTDGLVGQVNKAVAEVSAAPFGIVFDRVRSFGGRAVALAGPPEPRGPVHDLFDRLGSALGRRKAAFEPHLTLFCVDRPTVEWPMAERRIEAIGWRVRDFVLVHSHRGLLVKGTWPLREPPAAAVQL